MYLAAYAIVTIGVIIVSILITSAITYILQKKYNAEPSVSVFIIFALVISLTLFAIIFFRAT